MSNHGLCPSLGINLNFKFSLERDVENVESLYSDCQDVNQKLSRCKQGRLDISGLQPTLGAYPLSKSTTIDNTSSFLTDYSPTGKVPGFKTRPNYHEPLCKVPRFPNSRQNIHVNNFQFDHPQRYAPYPQNPNRHRIRTPTNLKPSLFSRQDSPSPSYPQAFPPRSVPSPRFNPHTCRQPYPQPHPRPLSHPHPQLKPTLVPQSHDQMYHSQCSCSVCAEVRCCTCNLCRKFSVGFQSSSTSSSSVVQNCTCQVCVQKFRNLYEPNFEHFYQNQNAHLIQNIHDQNRLMNNFQQIRNPCLHLTNLSMHQQYGCSCTCQACQQVRHVQHAQNVPNVAQTQASQILQTESLSEERDFYVPFQVSLEQQIQFDFEQCASNELNTPNSNQMQKTDDIKDIHEIFDNLLGHEDDFLDFDATI